jgi:ribose transport system substrate-binding protein
MQSTRSRIVLTAIAALIPVIAVAGCTTTGGSPGGTGDGGGPADPTALEKFYEGDYVDVPTEGPAAVSGKEVWVVSCGQAFEQCALGSEAFKEAGERIGWKVTIVDSKADPSTANALINQGVAAGVDGIATYALDCPTMKGGLEAAKAAGIPVVNFAGFDCDYEGFGGGERLFTRTLNTRGGDSFEAYAAAYQHARADVLLGYVGTGAKILQLKETSLTNSAVKAAAFSERIEEKCPDCELVPVEWAYAQVPDAATQVWKAAIQKNPDAAVISNDVDDILPLGFEAALTQSGRDDLIVIGSEGSQPALKAIREGTQTASLAIQSGYTWQMWGLADTLNRVFAGSSDFPDVGGGWILVDEDHNLPAEGEGIEVPDFKSAFEKIWAG